MRECEKPVTTRRTNGFLAPILLQMKSSLAFFRIRIVAHRCAKILIHRVLNPIKADRLDPEGNSGRRGRRFESSHPDQTQNKKAQVDQALGLSCFGSSCVVLVVRCPTPGEDRLRNMAVQRCHETMRLRPHPSWMLPAGTAPILQFRLNRESVSARHAALRKAFVRTGSEPR